MPYDDSWRDSYDAWKLASPPEYDGPECYHESFEIDADGLACCNDCQEVWRATREEIEHQREENAIYAEWCRKRDRREFWRKLTLPIRWPIFRLLERVWPRKSGRVLYPEEIEF